MGRERGHSDDQIIHEPRKARVELARGRTIGGSLVIVTRSALMEPLSIVNASSATAPATVHLE